MEFLSLKYSELRGKDEFNNRMFGAEVLLDTEAETPAEAMEKLVGWVSDCFKSDDAVRELRGRRDELYTEIGDLEKKRDALLARAPQSASTALVMKAFVDADIDVRQPNLIEIVRMVCDERDKLKEDQIPF